MQLYFPRDQDIPSVEMLEKRLNSLKEIPNIVEDDSNLIEENKESPMDTQENTQSVDDTSKAVRSSEECLVENTQQDVFDEHGVQSDESSQGDVNGDSQHAM